MISSSSIEPSGDAVEAVVFDMTLKLDQTFKQITQKLPLHMTLKHKRLTRVRTIILRWLTRFNSMETKRKCFTTLQPSNIGDLQGTGAFFYCIKTLPQNRKPSLIAVNVKNLRSKP